MEFRGSDFEFWDVVVGRVKRLEVGGLVSFFDIFMFYVSMRNYKFYIFGFVFFILGILLLFFYKFFY